MIEGVLIGFIGAIVPVLISIFGYQYLYNAMGGILLSNLFVLRPVFPFVYYLSYLLVLLGITVGLFGSYLSVTRYLRVYR